MTDRDETERAFYEWLESRNSLASRLDAWEEATRRERERWVAEIQPLLEGCSRCDYDEAEGEILNHCNECCRKVVAHCWTIVSEANAAAIREG